MARIGRRELLLLLIGVDDQGGARDAISGITRLQKLLFLLEKEGELRPSGDGFEFKPYKAGPYSSRLYDDLELLENLGLIRSEGAAASETSSSEAADIDHLAFDELISGFDDFGSPDSISPAPDSFEERKFFLTEMGRQRAEEALAAGNHGPVVDGIRRVKSKYAYYSLKDLLRYVYQNYPEMTTESEIIDEVMGKRGK